MKGLRAQLREFLKLAAAQCADLPRKKRWTWTPDDEWLWQAWLTRQALWRRRK